MQNHITAGNFYIFLRVLSDLEHSRVTIEKEQQEIETYRAEIEKLKKQLEEKQEKLIQSREKILREANEEARQILQDAKDYADETIRIINKNGGSLSMKDLEKKRQDIRGKIGEKNEKLALKNAKLSADKKKLDPAKLKKGDSVKILSMGLKGTVSTLPDNKGNLFVQCGIMRSQVNVNDLILIDDAPMSYKPSGMGGTGSGKIKMSKSLSISSEINLLGRTVDEAVAALDKYLDDAYLAHLPSVRIVHGKGTGALRSAVQSHLKKCKYVKSYRLGELGEGDAGVTIAEFK